MAAARFANQFWVVLPLPEAQHSAAGTQPIPRGYVQCQERKPDSKAFFVVVVTAAIGGGIEVKIGEAPSHQSAMGERMLRLERPLRSGISSGGSLLCLCCVKP